MLREMSHNTQLHIRRLIRAAKLVVSRPQVCPLRLNAVDYRSKTWLSNQTYCRPLIPHSCLSFLSFFFQHVSFTSIH